VWSDFKGTKRKPLRGYAALPDADTEMHAVKIKHVMISKEVILLYIFPPPFFFIF